MRTFYRRIGKRLLDLLLVVPAALILSPVIALVALVVRMKFGQGVLYDQSRSGRHGKPFRLYKFRTMTNDRDSHGNLLGDEVRLTTLGKRLRKYSLDELPQLWNVLRGDISLVGPRPLIERYLSRYSPEQARRLEVSPGITGWAQLNGRNAISWDRKFELDVWYVEHQSLLLDLKILWLTFWAVLRPSNISSPQHATMPEFMGNSSSSKGVNP